MIERVDDISERLEKAQIMIDAFFRKYADVDYVMDTEFYQQFQSLGDKITHIFRADESVARTQSPTRLF